MSAQETSEPIKVPFTRCLTVLMTPDHDIGQATEDIQTIKDGGMVVRTGRLENYFHMLRLAIAKEPSLKDKIVVFYPFKGELVEIDMTDSLRWPEGFLNEAWDIESQILRSRRNHQMPTLSETERGTE